MLLVVEESVILGTFMKLRTVDRLTVLLTNYGPMA